MIYISKRFKKTTRKYILLISRFFCIKKVFKMSVIAANILHKMQKQKINAHTLGKKIGIKSSTIYNVINERTKNPTIEVLISIAQALECSVSELIGEEKSLIIKPLPKDEFYKNYWNQDLYISALSVVSKTLENYQVSFTKEDIDHIIVEVYKYSCRIKQCKADANFCGWFIESLLSSKVN